MSRTTQTSFASGILTLCTTVALLSASVVGCGSPMKSVTTPPSVPVAPDGVAVSAPSPGTQVPIRLTQAISSRDTDSTEPVTTEQQGFVVTQDVRGKAGAILIKGGTPVVAQVTRKLHERIGREGKVTIRFQRTTAANGATVKLSDAPHRFKGRKRLGGVIAGSILLFPIGLLFLLLQGGDVTLESGSGFTAVVVE